MKLTLVSAAVMFFTFSMNGRENVPNGNRNEQGNTITAACNAGSAQTDIEINNVRTRILTGGDMWWDLSNPKYEVPKGSGDHSLFAGSLWIGGIDAGGQLKVAAMTYRQDGNDYWPGPLDTVNVSVDQTVCDQYDKHFRVKRKDVEEFYAKVLVGDFSNIHSSILNWPGNGNSALNQATYLAPYFDYNGDGVYNPYDGDYPDYDITGTSGCNARLYGDETLWWVFNDKGNVHTETGAEAIGLELQSQCFAFTTNDEINDMTFYQYKVINRSTYQLNGCYFGQWVDSDLGDYVDDYVGCNVQEGLGYCYNGDNQDGSGGPGSYGAYIPSVGVDFFQGPVADLGDGIDNDKDCLVDEPGELIGMARFVYYNNDWSPIGNPENATHYYNYLSGFWKDGLPFTYGGNAYNQPGPVCSYMFPGNTDQVYSWGTGGNCQAPQTLELPWDEVTEANTPADRRFLQSAGPFTLKPGAVNTVTVGVLWATTTLLNNNTAAIAELLTADKKAQALFDNCFQVLNGPDAPDITMQELDKELILYLSNGPTSNNYLENYLEEDPVISLAFPGMDSTYNFEGYQVWQLKDATVASTDLYNPDKARLCFQCDVKNGITQIVNFDFDKNLNANVPKEMVVGADLGIFHSVKMTDDLFAIADPRLVNHKTYHYMAVAYGYNNYKTYDQSNPLNLDGQTQPYKAGRRNIKVYSGIPHIPSPEAGGTGQQSYYGLGPKIKRIEGNGNGGSYLELTKETMDAIMGNTEGTWRVKQPTYDWSHGPVNIKVVDPLNVPEADFTLRLTGVAATSSWILTGPSMIDTSEKTISFEIANEQLIPEWGISVSITQVNNPGVAADLTKGFISASMTYADPTKQWLKAVADVDGYSYSNWIRCGTQNDATNSTCLASFDDYAGVDNDQVYEKVLGGTWSPYRLTAESDASVTPPSPCYVGGPCWKRSYASLSNLINLASVDIVMTSDKSKWTRCVVFETCDDISLVQPSPNGPLQNSRKLDLRSAPSVDKQGRKAGDAGYIASEGDFISVTGMGWFPGYAINLETGERLNVAFGENSWLVNERGRDMIWNPTNNVNATPSGDPLFGGMHFIYVFGHNSDDTTNFLPRYDYGKKMRIKMNRTSATTPSDIDKRNTFRDAMWVNIPLSATGYNIADPANIPSDVTIRLRVKKAYKKGYTVIADSVNPSQNFNNPLYTFNTADLHTHLNDDSSAVDAIELINVVPNPYYAYSAYEKNQVDTRIKITNLPDKATIKIFTLSGTLVKKIVKDDPTKTSIDWDLKNTAGIPIASGMYIIHVDAKDLNGNSIGEKILKWFGVMRPPDLETF